MHLIFLPLLLAGLWLVTCLIQGIRNPIVHVPGPWYARWTRLPAIWYWLTGQHTQHVQRLHEKYGMSSQAIPYEVDFASIAGAKRIHSFTRPFPKVRLYETFESGGPNVFSTRDVDLHARWRRLLAGAMSEQSLKTMEQVIQERISFAIEKLGQIMKENGAANIFDWWLYMATDVINELTFGDSMRMLEQGEHNQYFLDLLSLAAISYLPIIFPNLVKFLSYLPLKLNREVAATRERLGLQAENSLARYEQYVASTPHNRKPTLFDKLVSATGETLNRDELKSTAVMYGIAGSDPVAATLTYLVWAVCRNPGIQAKLVQELAGLPENYRYEDLKQLPYLNQVIKETMRVYSPAPACLKRQVHAEGAEIDGYWIPGGTEVQTQAYSMHRNPAIFPDPERFDPSRWETPTKDMNDAWMPFGGGSRVCLGLNLAKYMIRSATAKFFRAFPNARVSTRDGFSDDDMEMVIYAVMYPKKHLCLIEAS
ncbi:cytochrome P450 [Paraphoma chrysanthemicola]|uniref:Cytochrome P450 n=1 Tax=Paraphoma chrysanthemicola TaxID=798071 RepID=A0A8K0R6H2_9PLEO|nr:cytochrome P450 [Paraphoma chrysanthemicola]